MFFLFKNIYFKRYLFQKKILERTAYSKPTDSHLYLEASSCHKKSSKNGIIKGVSLCERRICSVMENFKITSSEYMVCLITRGNSAKLVTSEFVKVSSILRHEARKKIR